MFRLLVQTACRATWILSDEAVSHQVLFVDVFNRLKVTLGRLKLETVTLLERDLKMSFVLRRFGGETFAFRQLVLE